MPKPKDAASSASKQDPPPKSIFSNNDVFPAIFFPFLVIVVASLIGFAYSPLMSGFWGSPRVLNVEKRETVIPIKRVAWSPERSVLEYIDLHPDEPVIFENTQAEEWRARRVWKPAYLKRILSSEKQLLKGAYVHKRSVFGPYFDETRPMNLEGVRDTIERVNEHRLWSPDAEQFFTALEGHSGDWNYFAAKMQTMPESLRLDIQPFDKILDLDPSSPEENMNIWIGQQGVSAAAHYDGYDNINVQLYGRKQWNLYAPSNQSLLYLFPFLHFHHAQTQVDVENPDHQAYPLFKDALRYEGITGPGEALYMPAMWFHNVITLDTAINVNSWIKTPTSTMLSAISNQFPEQLSVHAAQVYIQQLLRILKKSSNFVRQALTTPRYSRLFDTGQLDPLGGEKDISQHCLRVKETKKVDVDVRRERKKHIDEKKNEKVVYHHVTEQEEQQMKQLAKQHAAKFKSVPNDTIDIWLGNHIEYVLAYATQDPILVGGILENCF